MVGAARSGTSILHELLARPEHAVPTTWKVHRPRPQPSATRGTGDGTPSGRRRRAVLARRATRVRGDAPQPRRPAHRVHLHDGAGCSSPTTGPAPAAPTYDLHLATADHLPAYAWHRRTLQTLQQAEGAPRWVLKAPSHLPTLRQLFATYPDARVIHIHRDPARTLPRCSI
ncbi:MAG: sulfotransferase [Acidimicrobiales bacterium]